MKCFSNPSKALVIVVTIMFLVGVSVANAGMFKIKPKGDKKIKIGVMDLVSSIEVAAQANEWYKKYGAERGWDVQVFDLNSDASRSQTIMQNMITAGYDAIIVNWTDFQLYEEQIMQAYKKGIPVQGIACGKMRPGVISHGIGPDMPFGALSALYLASNIGEGSKIISYHTPTAETAQFRFLAAKVAFDQYDIENINEMHYPGSGDPQQVCYDAVRNALTADVKKEVKGIWTHFDGYGVSAARAAMDMGREDIMVVTCNDGPNFYKGLREMPTLHASAGNSGLMWDWTGRMFKNLDKIFRGEPFRDQEVWFSVPYLVTKSNQPPQGYYYNDCGYDRKPDF